MEVNKSKYGVFIIESVKLLDEQDGQMDGQIIYEILKLCDVPTIYYYIRTRDEFIYIIEEFRNSNYRYLHLSLHGTDDELCFTFDDVDFSEFYDDIKNFIKNKRIFLSACKATNIKLANYIFNSTGCASLIGSPDKIDFDVSAVFWSSFYHLMKKKDEAMMQLKDIDDTLEILTAVFQIKISYYSFVRNNQKRYGFKEFNNGKNIKREYFDID